MTLIVTTSKFELGKVVITAAIRESLSQLSVLGALARHAHGEWGDLDEHDWKANDAALEHGFRLRSSYREGEVRFCIITEHDRSVTTVLLPDED